MKLLDQTQSKIKFHPGKRNLFQDESGSALVIVLLFMVVMMIIVPIAMQSTTSDISKTASFTESREAFYVADAGLEQAKEVARTLDANDVLQGADGNATNTSDNGLFSSITGSTTYNYNGNNYSRVTFNGGTYNIRAFDNKDEGTGTDDPWVDTDYTYYIESTGISQDGVIKTIRAMVQNYTLPPGKFPAAVTLVGPLSNITSQGSGFDVLGGYENGGTITNGFATDGTEDTSCDAGRGVATESTGPLDDDGTCDSATCVDFQGNAENHIKGTGGTTPDIMLDQTSFTATDAEKLHTLLTKSGIPDYVDNGNTMINNSDNVEWGTHSDPDIVYVKGDLDIRGDVNGAGVLIVDGDLDISGTFNWDGIVLIGSCATCDGALVGTGSATVYGAMVVGNSIDAAVNFTGNATIGYSCEGIGYGNNALNQVYPFTVASWKEMN